MTRLAADAGISQATMSRLLSGRGEPSTDSLRKLGNLWGYSLQQMMVFAGLADDQPGEVAAAKPAPPQTGVRVERHDVRHVQVDIVVDTHMSMDEAIESLGDLSDNERATVYMLKGMGYPPAEVAGAVMLLRGLDDERASQAPPGRRQA
jgi:hypothetical protein